MTEKKEAVSVRVSKAQRDRYIVCADREGRTLANWAMRALDAAADAALNTPPPTRPRGKTRE